MSDPTSELNALIRRLQDPDCYDHPVATVQVIETHVSVILLTGEYAYKIKKPLDLGFLDFSSLDKRLFACHEEVRLNQRLAPDYYLGVVPISGTPSAPRLDGPGVPFEYAVKMRQFPADATLDRLAAAGRLTASHVERMASDIARFHLARCERAGGDTTWGNPDAIWQPVEQNFRQIAPHLATPDDREQLDALHRWSEAEHARLAPIMRQRKQDGFIRECHGDLHLGNLAWVDNALLVFDCLEFNPALRWIDIISEIAFCYMDLMQRGHESLAWLFLNGWVERTGDHAGLALLRYYAVYRALVRVKVGVLRAGQARGSERDSLLGDARTILDLASALTRALPLRLDITHGLSGSGKTTVTQQLMQSPGSIRLRSDIERKRMAGLDALARSGSGTGAQLYANDATQRTYARLASLAGELLEAGWPVIVDATFLSRAQRDRLRGVAESRGVPFRILDFPVPLDTLRARVVQRARDGRDASEATLDVLQRQIDTEEGLAPDEAGFVTTVDQQPG